MKHNVGSTDKMIRIILGLAVLSLYFILEGNMKYISLLGLVGLATAFLNFCPLYRLIGVNTCKMK